MKANDIYRNYLKCLQEKSKALEQKIEQLPEFTNDSQTYQKLKDQFNRITVDSLSDQISLNFLVAGSTKAGKSTLISNIVQNQAGLQNCILPVGKIRETITFWEIIPSVSNDDQMYHYKANCKNMPKVLQSQQFQFTQAKDFAQFLEEKLSRNEVLQEFSEELREDINSLNLYELYDNKIPDQYPLVQIFIKIPKNQLNQILNTQRPITIIDSPGITEGQSFLFAVKRWLKIQHSILILLIDFSQGSVSQQLKLLTELFTSDQIFILITKSEIYLKEEPTEKIEKYKKEIEKDIKLIFPNVKYMYYDAKPEQLIQFTQNIMTKYMDNAEYYILKQQLQNKIVLFEDIITMVKEKYTAKENQISIDNIINYSYKIFSKLQTQVEKDIQVYLLNKDSQFYKNLEDQIKQASEKIIEKEGTFLSRSKYTESIIKQTSIIIENLIKNFSEKIIAPKIQQVFAEIESAVEKEAQQLKNINYQEQLEELVQSQGYKLESGVDLKKFGAVGSLIGGTFFGTVALMMYEGVIVTSGTVAGVALGGAVLGGIALTGIGAILAVVAYGYKLGLWKYEDVHKDILEVIKNNNNKLTKQLLEAIVLNLKELQKNVTKQIKFILRGNNEIKQALCQQFGDSIKEIEHILIEAKKKIQFI